MAAHRTEGEVRFAAEAPLFHVAIAYADVFKNLFNGAAIGDCLFRRMDFGFAHNFQERHACTIEVHETPRRIAGDFGVDRFAGILFQMDSAEGDGATFAVKVKGYLSVLT